VEAVTMTSSEPAYLTREEAAQRARVSVKTIDRAVASGALQAGGTYRVTRIKPEWVDEWLAKPRPARKRRRP
jgi:excisionase family DNA binding protein